MMNSNIPGQFITSARIQSKGISAESLQASHPEISAAALVATSDGTVRSSQSRKSGSSICGGYHGDAEPAKCPTMPTGCDGEDIDRVRSGSGVVAAFEI